VRIEETASGVLVASAGLKPVLTSKASSKPSPSLSLSEGLL
jgi:hypothetical protein